MPNGHLTQIFDAVFWCGFFFGFVIFLMILFFVTFLFFDDESATVKS